MNYDKKTSLPELPPTTCNIKGHLECSYYVANTWINVLNAKELLDTLYYICPDILLPEKRELMIPVEYTVPCISTSECSRKCKCVKNKVLCEIYWGCITNCKSEWEREHLLIQGNKFFSTINHVCVLSSLFGQTF